MRTVKVMSIIAIVVFSFSFLCLVGFSNNIEDYEAAIGWGIIAMIYGIPYAIASLVSSIRHGKKENDIGSKGNFMSVTEELVQLGTLKEKNAISEEEYDVMKAKLLSKISV